MFGGEYNRPDMRRFEANDPRPELRLLLRKWQGNPAVNRTINAPHIKSYVRYRETCEAGEIWGTLGMPVFVFVDAVVDWLHLVGGAN